MLKLVVKMPEETQMSLVLCYLIGNVPIICGFVRLLLGSCYKMICNGGEGFLNVAWTITWAGGYLLKIVFGICKTVTETIFKIIKTLILTTEQVLAFLKMISGIAKQVLDIITIVVRITLTVIYIIYYLVMVTLKIVWITTLTIMKIIWITASTILRQIGWGPAST